jgi:hypothetical protein
MLLEKWFEFSKPENFISLLANGCILSAAIYNLKGQLKIAYPLSGIATIIFFIYGFITKDISFVLTNVIFMVINILGIYKWTIKRKELKH